MLLTHFRPIRSSKPDLRVLVLLAAACFLGSPSIGAAAAREDKTEKKDALTLERIFPERSFFGPGASSMTFSHDGRFAAFLYRPYHERRHGSDLYIHDTSTGQTRRVTTASRMAEFEASTRLVVEDREKKAKAANVSLAQLAREQASQLEWIDDRPLGTWEGTAVSDGGPITTGKTSVVISRDRKGDLVGELSVGLVSLTIKALTYDDAASAFKGAIDDAARSAKGEFALSIKDEGASALLVLTEPAQTLTFQLTRAAAETPKKRPPPAGVIGAIGERLTLGDVVLDDDATVNDEVDGRPPRTRAPRYSGISSIEWSPKSHEMLLISDGEIYRLVFDLNQWDAPIKPVAAQAAQPDAEEPESQNDDATNESEADSTPTADARPIEDNEAVATPTDSATRINEPKFDKPVIPYRGELSRLTRTREREADVQYLPDGSGYTYMRSGSLLRVSFNDHTIMQLDPELKDGERMVGYRISPDQKRLVFLANRGDSYWSGGRQVTIVNYRDRFARAQTVTRHMPDDPWPEAYSSIYLYDLAGHDKERGTLERVFTRRLSGPRDIMRIPDWSPDSSRIAFAAFDQQSGHVKILEAGFVDANAKSVPPTTVDTPPASAESDKPATEPEEPIFKIENARVVYQFLHHGGPNTPGMVAPMYLPDSRRMVFITELSGFRHLHLLDPRYEALSQITEGQFEVYPFHLARDHSTLFVTATKDDPNQEQAYAIDLESRQMRTLTDRPGVFGSVAVRDDGNYLLARYVDFGGPSELVAMRPGTPESLTVLTDSHPEEGHKLTTASPEYFTYENRHGQTIHGHMFKPADWTPQDKRPLLIYVYGGPLGERKMATRGDYAAPSYFFARYMAEVHGWVAATIDPRGASGYGAVFEKANFEQVGKPQTEDLVDGARWFVKNHGVDDKKLAMHGWSFGGFQTQMTMYTEPDVFAVGMAGAGPTEWHNYNSWYSTGTIGANNPGRTDLEKFSLLPLAKNLKGKLLLVHGVEDSNVLYQDTVRVYRELLKAGKEVNVELFLDPTGGHGLGGDVKTIGRYRKYEDFLIRHLGKGTAHIATQTEEQPATEEAQEEQPTE
ncbi:MAG: prolyl oligopeptidase family serine peptidase [Phycisphaeraceae bacterium]|nr:prolyl oligopeptidase family serine peptidase [Phycisphaeraceae bacterium]MCW5763252.1 prolyl oligopeptidase family serine peptidase [Phycisphaeraceae bacterium]